MHAGGGGPGGIPIPPRPPGPPRLPRPLRPSRPPRPSRPHPLTSKWDPYNIASTRPSKIAKLRGCPPHGKTHAPNRVGVQTEHTHTNGKSHAQAIAQGGAGSYVPISHGVPDQGWWCHACQHHRQNLAYGELQGPAKVDEIL